MPSFRKAILLYNPVSGGRLDIRVSTVRRVAEIFRRNDVEVLVQATRAPGSGGPQAREAIEKGFDAVFACGGDGTVFDVLQGMAGTGATMGVIPLGTGNVLAHDLGLNSRAERAAEQTLRFESRRIALGHIECAGRARYFTVAAGVGVHAELLYSANARAKQQGGFLAYYTHGARLLFRHSFVPFPVEIVTADGREVEAMVLELVALRVRSFGGPLRNWRPGSSLLAPELRLVLLRNSSRGHLLRYALRALTGLATYDEMEKAGADFSFVSARSVRCHLPEAARARQLRVQADGELLGPSPAELSIVPEALTLLMAPQEEAGL